jgi:hypothetical protein
MALFPIMSPGRAYYCPAPLWWVRDAVQPNHQAVRLRPKFVDIDDADYQSAIGVTPARFSVRQLPIGGHIMDVRAVADRWLASADHRQHHGTPYLCRPIER